MATLDFAFLAEFAKVEATATITAVGAGIRGIAVLGDTGGEVLVYVAGGVDRDRGEGQASLTVTVEPPGKEYKLDQTAGMEPAPATGDYATTVFALGLNIPVISFGRYEIGLLLNDEQAGKLDLWISAAPGYPTAGV